MQLFAAFATGHTDRPENRKVFRKVFFFFGGGVPRRVKTRANPATDNPSVRKFVRRRDLTESVSSPGKMVNNRVCWGPLVRGEIPNSGGMYRYGMVT